MSGVSVTSVKPGGFIGQGLVIGDLRVQQVGSKRGRSFTIVWPGGKVHERADAFLRLHETSGTQRAYAYLLVDHLRWLERECLSAESVALRDLQRHPPSTQIILYARERSARGKSSATLTIIQRAMNRSLEETPGCIASAYAMGMSAGRAPI